MAQDLTFRLNPKEKCIDNRRLANRHQKKYESIINKATNHVITGGHPSAQAGAGGMNTFFGGNYFGCANDFLDVVGRTKIDWGLVVEGGVRSSQSKLRQCPPLPPMIGKKRKGSPLLKNVDEKTIVGA